MDISTSAGNTREETIADLFGVALAAEKAAASFYRGLSLLFQDVPAIAAFWDELMQDELMHVTELEEIRDAVHPSHLQEPADPLLLDKAKTELSRFGPKFDLRNIETLEDAYDVAFDLEFSEVNTVYQAIMSRYISAETRLSFVLGRNAEHVGKLETFSRTIAGPEQRRIIKAIRR